uniref:Malate dehydrogenase n=1 Tax=Chromera velia CCMP2878 TaxID=1169474 RepID=A0A0G4HWQ3_9ALVE|mmetsp:Transcript_7935/g.15442  ORF Transcript_7935/g.15442 Transcript_7935/m.15442 type:complete len:361 (+) Transcript_7935:138-1220(+)|eukprot:Cvel_9069.t1-p1 / transcript=Cvel_9069.t1 / gene=Cvel_9069 / organism=Chromera_velia_CCMP2878 / gene_product=L-sulfolactate dehydrogenase, putative / transcript_product=L-sulfolactate dehydrogenase, putative / location=Cvel_scaffold514:55795-57445(+) / protein_length=360 / sequence_SO=supercontig / SO=protein_coding / is_pseudo=false
MTKRKELTEAIPLADLKSLCTKAVKRIGYDDADTEILTDCMLAAQIRGNNQGIIKIPTGGLTPDPKAVAPKIVHESKLSARMDGGQTAGMVVVGKAVDLAVSKAKDHGIGMVGTFNTSTSSGYLGYYAKRAADKGLVTIIFANSPEFVCPEGAVQAIFGTNPLAFGIPRGDGQPPLILDMATAAIALFGVLQAKTAGQELPEGVAFDPQGNETKDPAGALAGAIRTFGGYKGSHLALMVELLAGPLCGAATENKKAAKSWGHLILCIDPETLVPADEFKKSVQIVLDRVKNAKRKEGAPELFLPGERGDATAAENEKRGFIEVEANLLRDLKKVAGEEEKEKEEEKLNGHTNGTSEQNGH